MDHQGRALNPRRSRRAVVGTALGLLVGSLASRAAPAAAREYCYWKDIGGLLCIGGRVQQQRCEICCGGGVCETAQCVWVVKGTC